VLKARLVESTEELSDWTQSWDDLAVLHNRPFAAPGWLLPWWRHVGSANGPALRAVLVTSGTRLVAVFPFWVERTRTGLNHYRLMGAELCTGSEPLAEADVRAESAALAMRMLLKADPPLDVLRLEGVSSESHWASALASAWPGRRPWLGVDRCDVAPFLSLSGRTFDDWLATKSGNFRKEIRRRRRRLAEHGFHSKVSVDLPEVAARLPAFTRLHRARWEPRGGSDVLKSGTDEMLLDVARAFSGTSRLQLWTMERDEAEVISARIFLGAGTYVTSWLAGFDDEWAGFAPGFVGMVSAIEHTWSAGTYQRIDLGVGTQQFKSQFADGAEQVEWKRAVRKGWRPLHTPAQFIPWEVRRRVSRLERTLRA